MNNILDNMEDDNSLRLTPTGECFPHMQKLRRSHIHGLDANQWDELCVSHAEGELHGLTELSNDDDFITDTQHIAKLRLKADVSITFNAKNSLKHRTPIRPLIWIAASAAAVIVTILVLPLTSNRDNIEAISKLDIDNTPAVEKINTTSDPIIQNIVVPAKQFISKVEKRQDITPTITDSANIDNSIQSPNQTIEQKNKPEDKKTEPVLSSSQLLALSSIGNPVAIDLRHAIPAEYTTVKEQVNVENQDKGLINLLLDKTGIMASNTPRGLNTATKGIVEINRLLGFETVVVKEYDKKGRLVSYSVQSKTFNFNRQYEPQKKTITN